ncbi:FHA domain-containing protein [Candidatus Uabimicrobium sp. HlEnr_7]|uniref:FHA domain-containing protein n=1 Tax=Candidatus Uabimicrobium helgolandensis TaxID=3095367 RepID=UPI003557DE66
MYKTKLNTGVYLIDQNTGEVFTLDPHQDNIIGRSQGQGVHTILLHHPAISKAHAVIKIESTQQWSLQNLSRNGSMLNGKAITTKKILTHSDEVTIGFCKLIFYENMVSDDETMEMPITNATIPNNDPYSKNYWESDDTDSRIENIAIFFFIILSLSIFAYFFIVR